MPGDFIKIEQRFQEQGRFLFFTFDEAVVPILLGVITRNPILLGIFAIVLWQRLKWLKGDGGLKRLLAATYWYLPKALTPYNCFPDGAVSQWRG